MKIKNTITVVIPILTASAYNNLAVRIGMANALMFFYFHDHLILIQC